MFEFITIAAACYLIFKGYEWQKQDEQVATDHQQWIRETLEKDRLKEERRKNGIWD